MREILFKAKRADGNGWVEGSYTLCHNVFGNKSIKSIISIIPIEDNRFIPVIPETVCQFTGLTDKNGKKIFEGDIIDVSEFLNNYFDGSKPVFNNEEIALFSLEELKGELIKSYRTDIVYDEGCFNIKTNSNLDYYDSSIYLLFGDQRYSYPIFEYEIIGNIHNSKK